MKAKWISMAVLATGVLFTGGCSFWFVAGVIEGALLLLLDSARSMGT